MTKTCDCFKQTLQNYEWMSYIDSGEKVLVMPHINKTRVNYCPVCGSYVRDFKIFLDEFKE